MFKNDYTLVIDGNTPDKSFKDLLVVLNTFGNVKMVNDFPVKDGTVTMIEIVMTRRQWKKLVVGMEEIGLPMFKVGEYWFI